MQGKSVSCGQNFAKLKFIQKKKTTVHLAIRGTFFKNLEIVSNTLTIKEMIFARNRTSNPWRENPKNFARIMIKQNFSGIIRISPPSLE